MANYAEQRNIADDETLRDILEQCSVDPDSAFEAANSPASKEALLAQTADAKARGIFGAPSFTVGDELFWGSDRLEAAIAWAKA